MSASYRKPRRTGVENKISYAMMPGTWTATRAAASFSKSTCGPRSVPSTHYVGFAIITGSPLARSHIDSDPRDDSLHVGDCYGGRLVKPVPHMRRVSSINCSMERVSARVERARLREVNAAVTSFCSYP